MSDYRMQQELEEERMVLEMDIVRRMAIGATNLEDALYTASVFGLLTEFKKEHQNEMGR